MRIIETARKRILNGNVTNPFVLDLNGVTIRLKTDQGFGAGSVGLADFDPSGKVYTAVDNTLFNALDPLTDDYTVICTTLTTSLNDAFQFTSFNQNISHFDTSNITQMQQVFQGCNSFNQDLSKWDVSKVTLMTRMFRFCSVFNSNLSNWDVSSVTNMTSLFQSCFNFNQDISNWDVSNVTNMNSMFNTASVFDQDISSWCVEQIPTDPIGFDTNTLLSWTESEKPNWGDPC